MKSLSLTVLALCLAVAFLAGRLARLEDQGQRRAARIEQLGQEARELRQDLQDAHTKIQVLNVERLGHLIRLGALEDRMPLARRNP